MPNNEEKPEQTTPATGTDAAPDPKAEATETVEAPKPEKDIAAETREWLNRTGRGDYVPDNSREAAREVRRTAETLRERAEAPPRADEPADVARLREVLQSGDDSRFLSELLDTAEQRAERRVMGRMTQNQKNQAFGNDINEFVELHAPDLPLVVFWAYADEADRRFPGRVDKQIDWAIKAGMAAMEQHRTASAKREGRVRENLDRSESLDGTPARGTRRGVSEREETFVEQLRKHQDQFI